MDMHKIIYAAIAVAVAAAIAVGIYFAVKKARSVDIEIVARAVPEPAAADKSKMYQHSLRASSAAACFDVLASGSDPNAAGAAAAVFYEDGAAVWGVTGSISSDAPNCFFVPPGMLVENAVSIKEKGTAAYVKNEWYAKAQARIKQFAADPKAAGRLGAYKA